MKKTIFIFLLFCIVIIFSPKALAATYPTGSNYRYLKGCFGEERATHDHAGIDIVGAKGGGIKGKPAYAFKNGLVIFAGNKNGYGNTVDIKHSDGSKTRYAHLDKIGNDFESTLIKYRNERNSKKKEELRKKLEVAGGQEIGEVGNTGTIGHHLHFEIRGKDGKLEDPQKYLTYELRSDTKGCGYPEVKSMGVVAEKKKKSGSKVIVEGLQEFIVYGNIRGDRVTRLYLDEYAEMKIDKSKVEAKFEDEGKNKGKYQYKSKFKLGDHVADIKITNFKKEEISKGHLDFAVDPVIRIQVLELEGDIKVIGELAYYNKNDAKIGGKLGEKLSEDSEFLSKTLKEKVRVITRSDEKIWPSEITINPDGTADVEATPTGLEDGPHTAVIEIVDENGNVTDSMQKIFYVDTKPPILELVEPSEDTILPGQKSFLVKFSDEGSGIPSIVEEMKVEAKVNGVDATINVSEKDNIRMLIIDDTKGVWKSEEEVNLYINIEDRAGNKTELNKKFHVREEKEEKENEAVECSKDGETTISQVAHTIIVPWPELNINSVLFKKSKKEHKIEFYIYTSLGYPVKNSVLNKFKITSNHTAISVKRLSSPKGSGEIRYLVSQSKPVNSDESLGSITIEHPEKIVHKFENSCRNGNPFSKFIEMESSSDVISYKVPVSLFWHEEFHDEAVIEDERFKYKVFFDKPGRLDIAASRFEIEDRPYWFKDAQEYYEIDLPAYEGLQTYKVVLSLFSGIWQDITGAELTNNKTCLTKNETFFVKLEPPVIDNFFYDNSKERFWAVIQDKGTELKDLIIRLNVTGESGIRDVQSDLNLTSGAMEADYTLPTGIESASLTVMDKAGQTTRVNCKVFGKPAEPEQGSGKENDYPVIYKKNISVNQKIVSPRPGEYYFYLGPASNGQHKFMKCISKAISIDAYWGCIKSYVDQGMAFGEAASFCDKLNELFLNDISTSCREILLDAMPPYIWDFYYNPASGLVTAKITDSGMPLSDLNIGFGAHSTYPSTVRYKANLPFSFNTTTGNFSGKFVIPSKGELFNVAIGATDKAGNHARASVSITAPRTPPDVSLKLVDMGEYYFPAQTMTAYLEGTFYDESGIDHDKTKLWIDNHIVQAFYTYKNRNYEPESLYFGANLEEGAHTARIWVTDNTELSSEDTISFNVSFTPVIRNFKALPTSLQLAGGPAFTAVILDRGKDLKKEGLTLDIDGNPVSSDRLYYDPASGYFAADGPFEFTGGRHLALLSATDDHGNKTEKQFSFIAGEKIVLAADDTKGLRIKEFILWEIANQNGDGQANPGELVRLFITLENSGGVSLNGVTGRLVSEDTLINVEQDSANYGTINPGRAPLPVYGFDIRIDEDIFNTFSADPFKARLNLEVTDDSGKSWSLNFILPVYKPTIPFSSPGTVTVKIDTLPGSTTSETITVSGSASSSASTIDHVKVYVNGQSFTASWDANTGRFSATVSLNEGSNVIEVQATDRSGAMGTATTFINRSTPYVPPAVNITNPTEGGSYMCATLDLTGTFDTGSSSLSFIDAIMTIDMGGPIFIPLTTVGNTFQSAGSLPLGNGNHQITVILVTTGGDTVTDIVNFFHTCE